MRPVRLGHHRVMKKGLLVLALLIVVVGVAKRFGPKMQTVDWEKRLERMPENAPPKWMFRNVTAIRENTERILRLLESERSGSAQPVSTPPPPEQLH